MKIPILVLATNSYALKEEFLRSIGLHLSNSTTLRGVVRDMIGAGISRKTLTIWAVEAGCGGSSSSSSSDDLDWSIVSDDGETRAEHVMLHSVDDLQKPLHGVFMAIPLGSLTKPGKQRFHVKSRI
jgi:hypothetical protein